MVYITRNMTSGLDLKFSDFTACPKKIWST